MPQRSHIASLAIACLGLAASCFNESKPPSVVPTRTLELPGEPASPLHRGPLSVVVSSVDPVGVVFDRPVRADPSAPPPASLRLVAGAPVPGVFRWIGHSALVFSPAAPLPLATELDLSVPAGLEATDGSRLAAPYSFRFATARPALSSVEPREGQIATRPSFDVRFEQPISAAEVERATRLLVGAEGRVVPLHARGPAAEAGARHVLEPVSELPAGAPVELVVDASLRGAGGPLPMGKAERFTMRTRGALDLVSAKRTRQVSSGRCSTSGIEIELSNPVTIRELFEHIHLEPTAPLGWSRDTRDALTKVDLRARLDPAQRYSVVVTAGMRDVYGQSLAHAVTRALEGSHEPLLEIGEPEVFALQRGAAKVDVLSQGVAAYDLLAQPLNEASLVRYFAAASPEAGDPLAEASRLFPGAKIAAVHPRSSLGAVDVHSVGLDALLAGEGGRGAALVVAETQGPTRSGQSLRAARVLDRTDLRLTANIGDRGGLAWVERLSTGKPVAGAQVSLYDATGVQRLRARTDEAGMAVFGGDDEAAFSFAPVDPGALLVARAGDDWIFRPLSDDVEGACGERALSDGVEGVLLTDRDAYRLGETIEARALFRGGAGAISGRPVRFTLTGTRGNVVSTVDGKLDLYGGSSASIPVPPLERAGPWLLRADLPTNGDHVDGVAVAPLTIVAGAEPEARIDVQPGRLAYVRGEPLVVHFAARDALGARLGDQGVRVSVTRSRATFAPPGADGWITTDEAEGVPEEDASGVSAPRTVTLAADGTASAEIALPSSGGGPALVSIDAELPGAADAPHGRAQVLVHPAEFYLALEDAARFVAPRGPFRVAALALDAEGQRREGVAVRFELLSTRGGARALSSCEATTTRSPAACDLVAPGAGQLVVRATATDGRHNVAAASRRVYAPGEPLKPSGGSGLSPELTLVPDRESYEVGQTATVLVDSSARATEGFLSVRGSGPPRGDRVHLAGSMPTFHVPVTPDLARGGDVSFALGGPSGAGPVARVSLRVAGGPRPLRITMAPGAKSPAPGDLFDVDLLVADPSGAPARASVTFMAVADAAPATDDPLQRLYEAPVSASRWLDSRAEMARPGRSPDLPRREARGELRPRMAGAGAGPGRTAFFDGALLTDVAGRAHVRFKVPQGAQSLVLTAVAATEDARFGFARTSLQPVSPLSVEASVPEVVRAGDRFDARVTIASQDATGTADVSLAALGVEVSPAAPQRVVLPPGGRADVRWSVRAPNVGRAELVFTARMGTRLAQARVARPVDAPAEVERAVFYGEASSAASDRLGEWAHVRPDVGGLDLKVSPSALVGLDDGLEQILRARYDDTEQHATRLVALTAMPDLLKEFAVVLPDRGGLADVEVTALLAAERADGAFAPAAGSPSAEGDDAIWRSAYALWALNAAAMHDHKIPSDATARAISFVRGALAASDRTPRDRAEAALALDVLTDLGLGDTQKIQSLLDDRAHLPLFARALLAHAMSVQQMDDSVVEDVLGDVESHLRTTPDGSVVVDEIGPEYAPLHDSSARATAMVLRALVARAKARAPNVFHKLRPSDLVARLARGLLSLRVAGAWRTPEETVWALRALEDFRAAHVLHGPDVDALFYLNGVELLRLPIHDRKVWQASASFGMQKVVGARAPRGLLGFRVDGDSTLHYEARLRYVPDDPAPVDRGFAIDRRVLAYGLGGRIRRGDAVEIEIVVATPSPRDHVVIEDSLPGGLAAPPASTRMTRAGVGVVARGAITAEGVSFAIDHLPAGIWRLRYTARADVVGRYVTPATRASCMFEPEVFGRSPPAVLEVGE